MEKLASEKEIAERMNAGFYRDWYTRCYNEQQRAYGGIGGVNASMLPPSGQGFPDWPDVLPLFLYAHQTRKVLATAAIALARNMGTIPAPVFTGPEIDDGFTPDLLAEFYKKRSDSPESRWSDQFESAFMDGDQLGMGYVYFGPRLTAGGKFRVDCEHIPLLHLLFDINAKHFIDAKWAAWCRYYSVDDAKRMYGERVEAYQRQLTVPTTIGRSMTQNLVRVWEYQDVGTLRPDGSYECEPTHAFILDDIGGEILSRERNEFEVITVAAYSQYLFSGMRRPFGRLHMQSAVQGMLNKIEKRLDDEMSSGGTITIYDPNRVDAGDMRKFRNGEVAPMISAKVPLNNDSPAIQRIAATGADSKVIEAMTYFTEELHAVSGITELDLGGSTGNNTLGQDQILTQRADNQQSWDSNQLIKFYRRAMQIAMRVAKIIDDAPITLVVKGKTFSLNMPGFPESLIANHIPDDLYPLIGAQDLTPQNNDAKKAMRLNQLNQYQPLIQMGLINVQWWASEMVKAMGDNPDEALMSQGQLGQVGGQMTPMNPMAS